MSVKRLFGKCGRFDEALSLQAAGRLPAVDHEALQHHLAQCPDCQAELARRQAVSDGLSAWKANQVPIAPSAERHFKLRQALKNAQANSPKRGDTGIAAFLRGKRLVWGSLCAAWAAILFLNLDAPTTIEVADQSQSISHEAILMVLKSSNQELYFEYQEPPTERPGLPPQSRLLIREVSIADC